MDKSFAQSLVDAYFSAVCKMVPDSSPENCEATRRAHDDLIQALTVPSVHSEEFPDLRDQFAMAALHELNAFRGMKPGVVAKEAFKLADAMMEARRSK